MNTLNNFMPSVIINAPDCIAHYRKARNFAELRNRIACRKRLLEAKLKNRNFDDAPLSSARKRLLRAYQKIKLFDPDNYTRTPAEYTAFLLLFRIFQIASTARILQIASNYGPFLYALRDQGYTKTIGMELDPYAVRYAHEIGNNVLLGNAKNIPLPDASINIVISYHFLDPGYFMAGLGKSETVASFIGSVGREIARVLALGGMFISSLETFGGSYPVTEEWPSCLVPLDLQPYEMSHNPEFNRLLRRLRVFIRQ